MTLAFATFTRRKGDHRRAWREVSRVDLPLPAEVLHHSRLYWEGLSDAWAPLTVDTIPMATTTVTWDVETTGFTWTTPITIT